MTIFPFQSPEAYSRAANIIARGSWSVSHPGDQDNAKPEGFQIEEMLWEVGRSQTLRINELQDAHDVIPNEIAPREDTTSGHKTALADRVRVVLRKAQEFERERDEARNMLKDYEDVLTDKRRLAREIDIAMHEEEGAAEQASLCDLVTSARMLRERGETAEARVKVLEEALGRIERWDLPATDQEWPDGSPVSYEAQWGSNGARSYMRNVARAALKRA